MRYKGNINIKKYHWFISKFSKSRFCIHRVFLWKAEGRRGLSVNHCNHGLRACKAVDRNMGATEHPSPAAHLKMSISCCGRDISCRWFLIYKNGVRASNADFIYSSSFSFLLCLSTNACRSERSLFPLYSSTFSPLL